MDSAAKKAQKEYMREYRKRNREKINKHQRDYLKRNPEKRKEYQQRYWEKKAKEMGIS